ncbi:MAG: D-2-hydroxyacid dehydrogenase family protein [Burkholderiaceae bacterium]|nr:D-2-hydroxyacid dehydrogenase family protein [Burkholderiaceae bacterium]
MRIAILDDYQDCVRTLSCFGRLEGHDVVVLNESVADPAVLAARLEGVEALVLIRERTRVTRELVALLPRLRIVSQTARVGTHIDVAACTERAVAVAAGTGSPYAPAELAFALILAAMRGIVAENAALRAGRWQTLLGRSVRGRTLGVLGYGNIGRLVAGYASALGMRVLAHGREGSTERARVDGVETAASHRALFAASDVLSVHLRLTPETRFAIVAADFAAMPDAAVFVNTSRSQLVAPGALAAALDAGRPAIAALDVFDSEPATGDPLISHPRVLATPHIGYVERDSYELYLGTAIDNVLAFASGAPSGIVNPEVLPG